MNFKLLDEKFKTRPSKKHPPVESNFVRLWLEDVEIKAETSKALLLDFDTDGPIWCPKSQCKIRWKGARQDDEDSVIDIAKWWYDINVTKKEIEHDNDDIDYPGHPLDYVD